MQNMAPPNLLFLAVPKGQDSCLYHVSQRRPVFLKPNQAAKLIKPTLHTA